MFHALKMPLGQCNNRMSPNKMHGTTRIPVAFVMVTPVEFSQQYRNCYLGKLSSQKLVLGPHTF
jgi:hypothetical protein